MSTNKKQTFVGPVAVLLGVLILIAFVVTLPGRGIEPTGDTGVAVVDERKGPEAGVVLRVPTDEANPIQGVSTQLVAPTSITPENDTMQPSTAEVDSYRVPVYTEGTVLDAMEAYRDVSDFTFKGKEYPGIGMFVESIGGRRASDDRYWILYVNGNTSDLGVSQAAVRPGDKVEWRFEESIY